MSERKANPSRAAILLRRIFQRSAISGIWAVAILGLIAVVAGIAAWQRYGRQLLRGESYRLATEHIEITPPPAWVKSDIRSEAVRDGSLSQLDLLDPELTLKVAGAFNVHSWVAKVKRVSKHFGPRVVVELEYRKPVAMVEVLDQGQRGLLPIDGQGVLLPPGDFPHDAAGSYLRIQSGGAMPLGLVGTPWGDPRITGAASIASLFSDRFAEFGLYRIAVRQEPGALPGAAPTYQLECRTGTVIVWGHAPGQEFSGEPNAETKATRLARYVTRFGPLDRLSTPVQLDLRQADPAPANEKTALRPTGS